MKKYIIAVSVAAAYLVMGRLLRGYWSIGGDLIVIAMAAISLAVLVTGVKRDTSKESEELPVKVARASGGVTKITRTK